MPPCGLSRGMCCVYMRIRIEATHKRAGARCESQSAPHPEVEREPIHVHFVLFMAGRNTRLPLSIRTNVAQITM
jgi:hypothetical protein